jgi:hypothetical protein
VEIVENALPIDEKERAKLKELENQTLLINNNHQVKEV